MKIGRSTQPCGPPDPALAKSVQALSVLRQSLNMHPVHIVGMRKLGGSTQALNVFLTFAV